MGYLKSIGTVIIYTCLFFAVITFLPGLPPDAEFSEYSIKRPGDTPNPFELKNRLQGAEVLFSGEIKGPESFASYNGELYTGIRGGYVVKIEENRIVPVVKFGKKCDGLWQEERCGRPLGLQFNSKGDLFVIDAYYGIFKVNVNTRQYTNIVNSSEPIEGKAPRLLNALDIAKNGDIYWVDSSADFSLQDGIYSCLANPSGRLIRYNAATKKNQVLAKELAFGNGVLLSDDESFLIVLESTASRIIKYHLKGPKAGQQEVFAEGLPGMPDNVHSDGQGGFLVSLLVYIDSGHPMLLQSLIPHPQIRKLASRLLYLIEAPFKFLQDVYPNYYAERVLHSVGSFDSSRILDTKETSVILRMSKTGTVLDALYSEGEAVHGISSAYIHNGYLWLGSPWNEYIMRVPLKQAFSDLSESTKSSNVKQQKKEEPVITVTSTPNVKVETKPTNAKPAAQKPTAKPTATTLKPTAQKVTAKPTTTTPKPPSQTSTTQKPATDATTSKPKAHSVTTTSSTTTTTTPKPPSTPSPPPPPPSSSPTASKAPVKETKTDKPKEINKDNSNSNVNRKSSNVDTESSKRSNKATEKPKSDETIKITARATETKNSEATEKKSDSTKK
ncbi:adipocyte plasma membrane-associated protein Hemomucin isoform X2 [Andrena cerasifolii]|uniref:adipocyte plasma membrane-associated protein Hemomucin isoform X2 n=1 Tax=Andrena cerasifolii TaxID=2819439 RepID=UPI004037FE34